MDLGHGSRPIAINAAPPLTFPCVMISNQPHGHPTNNTATTRYDNSIMARPIHAATLFHLIYSRQKGLSFQGYAQCTRTTAR